MKSSEDVEKVLERFGSEWPSDGSIVDRVMHEIQSAPVVTISPNRRKLFMKSLIGAAACLAVAIAAWLVPFFALTPSVTLAQVQAAVAEQKWLHVKYDNGDETWETVDGWKQGGKDAQGHLRFTDQQNNVHTSYGPGLGYINEFKAPAPPSQTKLKPRTLLEIVGFELDMPEGEATAKQKGQIAYTERHADKIDGRHLVRFDHYQRDGLGQYPLMSQMWVDPQTRLPVRVRSVLQDGKFKVGQYDFPASGPENIYDLGAPRGLPIVAVSQAVSGDVGKVIEAARKAQDRFPGRYRLIVWPEKEQMDSIDVIYRDGAPVRKQGWSGSISVGPGELDWSGVRIRMDHYFNVEKHQAYCLSLPATAEQVMAWAKTQVPVSIYMADDKRIFDKYGPLPAPFHNKANDPGPTRLRVDLRQGGREPCLPCLDVIVHEYWPVARDHTGPYAFPADGAKTMPGTIAVRREAGDRRDDFYLDPAHDYICINQIGWEKRSGKWEKTRETKLLNLRQLPQGQWYATKKHIKDYGNPAKNIGSHEASWNLDLLLLQKDQFPPDAFNGEKLLKDSKREGAIIEAR